MELIQIYQCLCDATRLRLVHLISKGPLCVCHFQEILELPQTKVSQHLAYLRKRGMVETTRCGQRIIYRLPVRPSAELEANLRCLQDCMSSDPRFRRDLKRLDRVRAANSWIDETLAENPCC